VSWPGSRRRPQVGNVIHKRVKSWNLNKTRCGIDYSSRYSTGDNARVTCADCQQLMVNDVEVALYGSTALALVHYYVGERGQTLCHAPVLAGRTSHDRKNVTCKRCLDALGDR